LCPPGFFVLIYNLRTGNGVHRLLRIVDLHVGRHGLDGHEHHDGQEGGEQSGQDVILATVLAHLNHLGDDPANNVHPGDGAGEGEARNNGVQGLGLELKSDGRNHVGHFYYCIGKKYAGSQGSHVSTAPLS
jgi:hypothetical protein